MPPSARFLATSVQRLPPPPHSSPAQTTNTDLVVILASLLCAMVSVAGLTLVVRCVCSGRSLRQAAAPGKGLKNEALRRLPKVSYGGGEVEGHGPAPECPICLAEFEEGDQLRVLPQCGHVFHVGCVDAWLRHHSSCPSCRRLLVVPLPPSRFQGCREANSIDAAEPAPSAPGGAFRP